MSKISEEQAQEQLQILAILGEARQSQEEAAGYTFDAASEK
jgi:hydrogenase expression/formation protein HypC